VSTTISTQALSGLRPASDIGRVMFSSAVSVGTRLNAWKMKPILSRRSNVRRLSSSLERSVSPMKTLPELSESSPATVCIRVDLPEPLGPMIAVNSWAWKSTVTASRAVTAASPCP